MTFPTGAPFYSQGFGSTPTGAVFPTLQTRAPTANDVNWPIGQQWVQSGVASFDLLGFTSSGGVLQATWSNPSGELATTTTAGNVFLGTTAQTASGGAPNATYVASSNDVAAAIAGLVIGQVPVATTGTQGIGALATNAQAVAGTASTGALALFLTPSNLSAVFAAPSAIGGTTPAAGVFTTLGFTTMTGTAGGDWASGGTAIRIGHDASADNISIGDTAAARTILIGNTSATNTSLIGGTTLTLNGTTSTNINIGAGLTTGTLRIGGTAQSTGHIELGNSTAN